MSSNNGHWLDYTADFVELREIRRAHGTLV